MYVLVHREAPAFLWLQLQGHARTPVSQPSSECSDRPDLQFVRDFITVASSVVTSVFIIAITAARGRRVVGFFTASEWCLSVPAYLIRKYAPLYR